MYHINTKQQKSSRLTSSKPVAIKQARSVKNIIQLKLKIGAANDKYEQEADRVADQVMRMPAPAQSSPINSSQTSNINNIQRKCAGCAKEDGLIQKKSSGATPEVTPSINSSIQSLQGGGQPLSKSEKSFFEPRFGADFSHVRLHTDSHAASTAKSINARAFTHRNNIVFGAGEYAASSVGGKRLMAHELTHTIQQNIASQPSTFNLPIQSNINEHNLISRNEDITSRTMLQGVKPGSGFQFLPTKLTDTVVGAVSIQGGLLNTQTNRLNVIIGANMTLRILAAKLLPLWTSAKPFTPVGSTTPLHIEPLTGETLAKALLVYNQTYFRVPTMTRWWPGLNIPLPIVINKQTGIGTLHPTLIIHLAERFDPSWNSLLDTRTVLNSTPSQSTISSDVTSFLNRQTTTVGQAFNIIARMLTNPLAELAFITELFQQLDSRFVLALKVMDNLVNIEVDLIASQQAGSSILNIIKKSLNSPVQITPQQQQSLDRANTMLNNTDRITSIEAPVARQSRSQRRLDFRRSRSSSPCACLVFIHNNERNARLAAQELHSSCNYNLAIVDRDDIHSRTINIAGTGSEDPNGLFDQATIDRCEQDEQQCREYESNHNDIKAVRIQFFLALKECANGFTLPVVALHNNKINDTESFKQFDSNKEQLINSFSRNPNNKEQSLQELITKLNSVNSNDGRTNKDFRFLLNKGGTTNIIRWCNLPEILKCNIGDPIHPDFVIWTTNIVDYNSLKEGPFNVVLQSQELGNDGESVTDLSTLFIRLGSNLHFINIETPHTNPGSLDNTSVQEGNMSSIKQVLQERKLLCCNNE